jgi:hypothetical protein
MTIAWSNNHAFFGTDEATGAAVANNATGNGAEVDILGDTSSLGEIEFYAMITSTVAVGTIDITINKRRSTGQAYKKLAADFSIAPKNGTQLIPLGRFVAERYMQVDVFNNGTGASATVTILGNLFKVS